MNSPCHRRLLLSRPKASASSCSEQFLAGAATKSLIWRKSISSARFAATFSAKGRERKERQWLRIHRDLIPKGNYEQNKSKIICKQRCYRPRCTGRDGNREQRRRSIGVHKIRMEGQRVQPTGEEPGTGETGV